MERIRQALVNLLVERFLLWALGTIGGGTLVVAIIAWVLGPQGPAFLLTWAALFLFAVLAINSIIQTSSLLQNVLLQRQVSKTRAEGTVLLEEYAQNAMNVAEPLPVPSPQDVLTHAIVGRRHQLRLDINQQDNAWPIMFPVLVQNVRPIAFEIIHFDVEVSGGGTRLAGITWPYGGLGLCSNGRKLIVEDRVPNSNPVDTGIVEVPGDDYRVLRIPIDVAQIQPKPATSPILNMRGNVSLRCNDETREIQIANDPSGLYLEQGDWDTVVKHVENRQ